MIQLDKFSSKDAILVYIPSTQALLEKLSHIVSELSMKDLESSNVGRYSSSLVAD